MWSTDFPLARAQTSIRHEHLSRPQVLQRSHDEQGPLDLSVPNRESGDSGRIRGDRHGVCVYQLRQGEMRLVQGGRGPRDTDPTSQLPIWHLLLNMPRTLPDPRRLSPIGTPRQK